MIRDVLLHDVRHETLYALPRSTAGSNLGARHLGQDSKRCVGMVMTGTTENDRRGKVFDAVKPMPLISVCQDVGSNHKLQISVRITTTHGLERLQCAALAA
jgi:hypothetical protein